MPFLDGLTVEQLNRLLSLSRWGPRDFRRPYRNDRVFNQYITDRVANLQKAEKEKAALRKRAAEEALSRVRDEAESAKALAAALEARQKPRILPPELVQAITQTAAHAADKENLQISCVVGDPEAWALAEQIRAAS